MILKREIALAHPYHPVKAEDYARWLEIALTQKVRFANLEGEPVIKYRVHP